MKVQTMTMASLIILAIIIPLGVGDQDQVSLRLLLSVGKNLQLQSLTKCQNGMLHVVRKKKACILLLAR